MKFTEQVYLKHQECIDVFLRISSVVVDTGSTAIVWASWMVQGTESHWHASNVERIVIKPAQYEKWMLYYPKGEVRYG